LAQSPNSGWRIVRTDKWGDGAKPFQEKYPWAKKIFQENTMGTIVFSLLLPHVVAAFCLSRRISTNANKLVAYSLLIFGLSAFALFGVGVSEGFIRPDWWPSGQSIGSQSLRVFGYFVVLGYYGVPVTIFALEAGRKV
jgi:hypothetical protein